MNGMDDSEDEHNFSDDDLDALPDDALLELEQNAISATQHPRQVHTNPYKQRAPLVAPVRPEHIKVQSRPPAIAQARPQTIPTIYHNAPHHEQIHENQYDGGFLDDSNVATPVEENGQFIPQRTNSEMTQREQWRQQQYSRPNPEAYSRPVPPQQQRVHNNYQQPVQQDSGYLGQSYVSDVQDSMLLDDPLPMQQPAVPSADEGLRLRLEELIRERDELTKELQATKGTVLTQKGEIAIIRANQSKETKVFDRQLSALKKSMQDESARSKASLQAIAEESRKVADQNTFLKQDLAEEAERSKKLSRTLKERPQASTTTGIVTTPQKAHAHSLRDGFDDDEIMAVSPVKSGKRSQAGTPTAGGKRKRKVDVTSPVPALVLRPSNGAVPVQQESEPTTKTEKPLPTIRKDLTAEKNLKFMQRILNHRMPGQTDHIIETCMAYSFPSTPHKTFTTTIIEATTRLSGTRAPADLLAVFAKLWSSCLAEKYYKPIALLMDTINFIIALSFSVIVPSTLDALLPVLQSSVEIDGTTRFRYSPVAAHKLGPLRQTPQSELQPLTDGTACLEMLFDLASHCLDDSPSSSNTSQSETVPLITHFWRSMTTDCVLMMLNSSQPIRDLMLMLHLLSTSIQPTTFGNICATPTDQAKMEDHIVGRVCWLLWETPRVDEGVTPYTQSQICELRLEVLDLLIALAAIPPVPISSPQTSSHGLTLLQTHPAAIARLTRLIYDSLDALLSHPKTHPLHARLINIAIPLLAHLTLPSSNEPPNSNINISTKLSAVNGGIHKHRVALTRLAFSEGIFLDAGITDQTVRLATEMLEEAVTPEEAEGLLEAFPGRRRAL